MGIDLIILLVIGLVGTLASAGVGIGQAVSNKQATEQANETNLQIARETNQANVEQANLAYQRSLPINQVRNLMDAGMSRAGALSALTGGGSYTAPTLQGTQVQPETMDLSGVAESMQRLGNIPGNVEQAQMMSAQRTALEQQTNQREQAFKTEMQIKSQELLGKKLENIGTMYGQRVQRETDELANSIVDAMYSSGRDIDSFDSEQSIYDLMKDNELFKNSSSVARQNAIDLARQRKQDKNVNRAADDKHNIDTTTRNKLQAELNDFNAAKSSREKERQLKILSDSVAAIARARDLYLDSESIKNVFEFDENGNIILENGLPKIKVDTGRSKPNVYAAIRGFWNDVSEIIPVNVLAQVFRFILR